MLKIEYVFFPFVCVFFEVFFASLHLVHPGPPPADCFLFFDKLLLRVLAFQGNAMGTLVPFRDLVVKFREHAAAVPILGHVLGVACSRGRLRVDGMFEKFDRH